MPYLLFLLEVDGSGCLLFLLGIPPYTPHPIPLPRGERGIRIYNSFAASFAK
jgi:hypothetical protein